MASTPASTPAGSTPLVDRRWLKTLLVWLGLSAGILTVVLIVFHDSKSGDDKHGSGSNVERDNSNKPTEITVPGRPLKKGEQTWVTLEDGKWSDSNDQSLRFERSSASMKLIGGEAETVEYRDGKHLERPPIVVAGKGKHVSPPCKYEWPQWRAWRANTNSDPVVVEITCTQAASDS